MRRREPELFDRLLRVLEEQRGHTLAMEVEKRQDRVVR